MVFQDKTYESIIPRVTFQNDHLRSSIQFRKYRKFVYYSGFGIRLEIEVFMIKTSKKTKTHW